MRVQGEPNAARDPDQSNVEVRRFDRDAWEIRIFISGQRASGSLSGYADLYRDGSYKCRITTARDHRDARLMTDDLEARANAWVDEWLGREHTGDTGFVDL